MGPKDLVALDEFSTAERVFDALRGWDLTNVRDFGDGEYPENLAVKVATKTGFNGGLSWEENIDVTAYVVTWTSHSWSRRTDIPHGYTIIDLIRGGLDPDGWASLKRYIAPVMDDEEIKSALLLAARGKMPFIVTEREL